MPHSGGHQVTPVSDWYIPRDPKDKQKSYSFPSGPPSSLSNDSKIEFHKEGPTIETAIPLQGLFLHSRYILMQTVSMLSGNPSTHEKVWGSEFYNYLRQ